MTTPLLTTEVTGMEPGREAVVGDEGMMLAELEKRGELERTTVVVTGDNGLPFPRCKSNLYDTGTRVPLAVRWGERVVAGHVIEDFVSLADLAPTFLEAGGADVFDRYPYYG